MKQKTTFITIALVVAVLALGIAYAAITQQTLNVAGNAVATASDDNFSVNFVGQAAVTKSADVTDDEDEVINPNSATVTSNTNGKSGTFSISGLDTKGEYVILKFPIVNSSPDLAATLTLNPLTGVTNSDANEDWWKIEASLEATELVAVTGNTNLVVKVTLMDTPATEDEAPEGVFHVQFTADPA